MPHCTGTLQAAVGPLPGRAEVSVSIPSSLSPSSSYSFFHQKPVVLMCLGPTVKTPSDTGVQPGHLRAGRSPDHRGAWTELALAPPLPPSPSFSSFLQALATQWSPSVQETPTCDPSPPRRLISGRWAEPSFQVPQPQGLRQGEPQISWALAPSIHVSNLQFREHTGTLSLRCPMS